jgi:hypothetical protein
MISNIVNITAVVISLVTASGIFLHDTRVDKAATTAITLPAEIVADTTSSDKLMNWDAHTHVERMTFSQTVRDLQGTSNPRIQPRTDDKKHLLQNRVARGHHPFDNYNLPLI